MRAKHSNLDFPSPRIDLRAILASKPPKWDYWTIATVSRSESMWTLARTMRCSDGPVITAVLYNLEEFSSTKLFAKCHAASRLVKFLGHFNT